jgi:hypothetical protein
VEGVDLDSAECLGLDDGVEFRHVEFPIVGGEPLVGEVQQNSAEGDFLVGSLELRYVNIEGASEVFLVGDDKLSTHLFPLGKAGPCFMLVATAHMMFLLAKTNYKFMTQERGNINTVYGSIRNSGLLSNIYNTFDSDSK